MLQGRQPFVHRAREADQTDLVGKQEDVPRAKRQPMKNTGTLPGTTIVINVTDRHTVSTYVILNMGNRPRFESSSAA